MTEEKVKLLAKRKNIELVFTYCLDNRITFTVSPKGISPDEYELELNLVGIKQAIALGMFAKEHKFEVLGMGETAKPKVVSTASKKPEVKENEPVVNGSVKAEPNTGTAVLNF